MIVRVLLVAAVLAAVAFALWHPASRAPIAEVASSSLPAGGVVGEGGRRRRDHPRRSRESEDLVVYVAGAVRRAGLYHLRDGDRYARAVALAGGFSANADAAGVNLAQRAADGDEVLVPRAGETRRLVRLGRRGRRVSVLPAEGSVDVNAAGAEQLARVPGIGRSIAARIVELREREGEFHSLDELLDVAGMTQTRLERARAYLRAL